MLNMTLDEIKGQIQMYPENWINISTTNCYAYALGLDINEKNICHNAYQPGTISEFGGDCFLTYTNLVKAIEQDLRFLDISYCEIEPQASITLDEWKIALLVKEYYDHRTHKKFLSGFHCLRINKTGIWVHKPGYPNYPSERDYNNQIITDPREFNFHGYEYKKCYALKLNKR